MWASPTNSTEGFAEPSPELEYRHSQTTGGFIGSLDAADQPGPPQGWVGSERLKCRGKPSRPALAQEPEATWNADPCQWSDISNRWGRPGLGWQVAFLLRVLSCAEHSMRKPTGRRLGPFDGGPLQRFGPTTGNAQEPDSFCVLSGRRYCFPGANAKPWPDK